ncbi:MAG: replicative DNA helicase, partial [Candidatus Gribaldobacteria bacterium]|nr:replicative DNA helicase [Candidatus Gribaldobacteria bacterium]
LRNNQKQISIYYSSTSYQIAESVKYLLLRFGMRSKIAEKHKGDYRTCYTVSVYGKDHQMKFLKEIGCHGERGKSIPQFIEKLESMKSNTNLDVWPKEIWEYIIEPLRIENGITTRGFVNELGIKYNGTALLRNSVGMARLSRIADFLKSEKLKKMAKAQIFWDEITSIKELGEAEVFDATVPETHNFIANGIILHNSIEQDADVVMFIYREDRYKQNSERQGIADIIVAKHRNGPVGKVELFFDETRASFRNMAKGYTDSY